MSKAESSHRMDGRLTFSVRRHRYWCGQVSDMPQPTKVDPMLRRRLSPQGRLALALAEDVIGDVRGVRIVFASRHGELARTHGLVEALRPAAENDPSPSAFTLSVLNSTSSVLSIARRDTSPALALAAGAATPWYGLLEAASLQAELASPVLLLCADAPVPSVFLHGAVDAEPLRSLALMLDAGGEDWEMHAGELVDGRDEAMGALAAALENGSGGWGGWGIRRR